MTRINKAEQKAYNYIKNQIVSGSWPAPTKIVEQDISDVLDISRSPVRAAIKRLAEEGLLVIEPYKGAIVAKKKLNKQEFVDRMEMFEMLVQQYLYLLEGHNFHLNTKLLERRIETIKESIREQQSTEQLSYNVKQFMEDFLNEQPNQYICQTIMAISEDILYVDLNNSNKRVMYLYELFVSGLQQMVHYLSDDDYPKARKEVRIFVNKLMLEVIDQQLAS